MVCKWTYEIKFDGTLGWNQDYFKNIGLEDLVLGDYEKIGTKVQAPGSPVGHGLSKKAAMELDLLAGTPVGTSIIDAHAGGLGLIGCSANGISEDFSSRLSNFIYNRTCVFTNKIVFFINYYLLSTTRPYLRNVHMSYGCFKYSHFYTWCMGAIL